MMEVIFRSATWVVHASRETGRVKAVCGTVTVEYTHPAEVETGIPDLIKGIITTYFEPQE